MMCHTSYFISIAKKLKAMTRILVIALLTGCGSTTISVTPATSEVTTIVPTPTNPFTILLADQPGEVIIVEGDCLSSEVEVNGFCMDRGFIDFFCILVGCTVPPPGEA